MEKDVRRTIKNPILVQKHQNILADFPTLLDRIEKRYADANPNQRPSKSSMIDTVCADLAIKYYLSKGHVEDIVNGRYKYNNNEEASNHIES